MKLTRMIMVVLLVICPSFHELAVAEQASQHVVTTDELQQVIKSRTVKRAENITEITKLLRHDVVQQQVGKLVDLVKIEKSLPTLSDETLSEFAVQSSIINDNLRGGLTRLEIITLSVIGAIILILLLSLHYGDR